MARKKKNQGTPAEPVNTEPLIIPEDEIWTYQIEGLQEPRISRKNISLKTKLLVVAILLVAISCSIFLSIRAVHNDTYKYGALEDGTVELIKFSNPGNMTEVTVDLENGNSAKPVTVLHEYAFNCDEKITSVTIGKGVSKIDGKAFYSCWSLQNIFVDDENPYYCDLDGVLYTKDLTEIVHYPCDHDKYLRQKTGFDNLTDDNGKPMEELWSTTEQYDEAFLEKYNRAVRTYVVPSTVTKIGKLAFAYSNITDLYLPEGVKTIETMGVFKNTVLREIYSYTGTSPKGETGFDAVEKLSSVYRSLPEGLTFIGSDAFTYDRGLSYLYLPASVTEIGHHAFWDTVYKEDGELRGVQEIHTPKAEAAFRESTKCGDSWLPKYDHGLFKKNIAVCYDAERQAVSS